MVEVFKTDVSNAEQADLLVRRIQFFTGYSANFDLEDSDHILRVESEAAYIQPSLLIHLLKDLGYCAEVLTDDFHEIDKNLNAIISKTP